MGDCNHCTYERAVTVKDDITVVFHKVDGHGDNNSSSSGDDRDECVDDERTAERIHLQSNTHVSSVYEDDAEEKEGTRGSEDSPEGSEKKTLCPPAFCVRSEPASREGRRVKTACKLESGLPHLIFNSGSLVNELCDWKKMQK